jgi:hypothetical protein
MSIPKSPQPTAAWRLNQMTPVDGEIWDYWVAWGKPALRHALIRHSIASDFRDLELIGLATEIAMFGPAGIELAGNPFRGWTSGSWES